MNIGWIILIIVAIIIALCMWAACIISGQEDDKNERIMKSIKEAEDNNMYDAVEYQTGKIDFTND